MIQGTIFDADGTLLDSMGMWDHAGERYLESLGIAPRSGLREILFPLSLADCAVYLKKSYALPLSHGEIAAGINGMILNFYRDAVRLKPGAKTFLEALRRRGIGITLATATDRAVILEGLRRTGILPLFDGIYTCGELGVDKQTPDIYHLARREMGTRTEETWVFEDAVHAAKTAYAAGFPVAGVADLYSDQKALREVSTLYLPGLTDFPGFYRRAVGE